MPQLALVPACMPLHSAFGGFEPLRAAAAQGKVSGESQADVGNFAHSDLEAQLSASVCKSTKGGSSGSQQRSPGAIAASDLGPSSRQPFKLEGPLGGSEKVATLCRVAGWPKA